MEIWTPILALYTKKVMVIVVDFNKNYVKREKKIKMMKRLTLNNLGFSSKR